VCAFKMDDIVSSFEGAHKEQKSAHSNWLPVRDRDVPEPRPAKVSRTVQPPSLYFVPLRIDYYAGRVRPVMFVCSSISLSHLVHRLEDTQSEDDVSSPDNPNRLASDTLQRERLCLVGANYNVLRFGG